jgi:hypothetical protein
MNSNCSTASFKSASARPIPCAFVSSCCIAACNPEILRSCEMIGIVADRLAITTRDASAAASWLFRSSISYSTLCNLCKSSVLWCSRVKCLVPIVAQIRLSPPGPQRRWRKLIEFTINGEEIVPLIDLATSVEQRAKNAILISIAKALGGEVYSASGEQVWP